MKEYSFENIINENFKNLVKVFKTNDGYQIDDITTIIGGYNPIIVYVSFNQIISNLEVFEANTEIDKWDAINKAIAYYFNLTLVD